MLPARDRLLGVSPSPFTGDTLAGETARFGKPTGLEEWALLPEVLGGGDGTGRGWEGEVLKYGLALPPASAPASRPRRCRPPWPMHLAR
eukprot:536063-Rhodomonas_salina.1